MKQIDINFAITKSKYYMWMISGLGNFWVTRNNKRYFICGNSYLIEDYISKKLRIEGFKTLSKALLTMVQLEQIIENFSEKELKQYSLVMKKGKPYPGKGFEWEIENGHKYKN